MTCFSRYPQLSDLSRGDGSGEDVGGKQEPRRREGRYGGVVGCVLGEGGGGVPCEEGETLLSPVAGLGIALSLLVRELMQLSVLILESSFYSFSFFLSLPPLLCNLFFYSVSAVIRTVAADDKKYIRLPDFSPPPPSLPSAG